MRQGCVREAYEGFITEHTHITKAATLDQNSLPCSLKCRPARCQIATNVWRNSPPSGKHLTSAACVSLPWAELSCKTDQVQTVQSSSQSVMVQSVRMPAVEHDQRSVDTIAPARSVITCSPCDDTGHVLLGHFAYTACCADADIVGCRSLSFWLLFRAIAGVDANRPDRRLAALGLPTSLQSPCLNVKTGVPAAELTSTLRQVLHWALETNPHWTVKPSESVAVCM